MTAYHLAGVAILLVAAGLTWRAGDTTSPDTGRHHMTAETRARGHRMHLHLLHRHGKGPRQPTADEAP